MKRRNQEREYDEEDRDGGGLWTKSLTAAGEDVFIEKENRRNNNYLLAGVCGFT